MTNDADREAFEAAWKDYQGVMPSDPVPEIEEFLSGWQAALAHARQPGEPVALSSSVVKRLKSTGRVQWGATEAKTDEEHVADFAQSLRLTREYFNLPDGPRRLEGVYLDGTDIVLCHTGTSPNSPDHARILTGAWNWLVDIAERQNPPPPATETTKTEEPRHD